ncbi:deoxyribose-phosphate aldolase [Ornithinimicrobium pratense]|uniref:Deoxyribose-phosphate aldolase n=1 Tax=Ornithinimicrobium pratense TaxID=2593973 RepID=A0A5J6V9N1_9MICO|nr:deoxyribose-phosphate aldolase [Ornithinimicrobium pratense]QFG69742.1 deoxyribose-phosphate aldolase [Ornithinimicrobium pratense]
MSALPLDVTRLPRHVDISCVQAFHGRSDVELLAERAVAGDFVSAHVLPSWLPLLRTLLEGSATLAGGPVGFPSGGTVTEVKVEEARRLLDLGAQELDVVVNVGQLRSGMIDDVRRELEVVVRTVDDAVPLRAILEVGYLDDQQILAGAQAAVDAGVPWVKTGTGWSGQATEVRHIRLLADAVQGRAQLKAAGGIRALSVVREMIALGVTRFGMNGEVAMRLAEEARGASEAP